MINIRNEKLIATFGKRVKQLRIEKKYSQETLANMAEIPISQIARIEHGKLNTTLSTIFNIAVAFDIDPKDLLDFSSLD